MTLFPRGLLRASGAARRPLSVALVSLLLLGAGPCDLEPDQNVGGSARDAELQAIVEQIARSIYGPDFGRLAVTATALPVAAAAFCGDRSASNLEALQVVWRGVMRDWQRVQPATSFGPAEDVERRIQLFPGGQIPASETVADLVDDYLAGTGEVDAATLGSRSVAIQGLSALEYLTYEPAGAVLGAFPATSEGDRRCDMVQGIAQNVENVTMDVAAQWQDTWVELLVTAESGNAEFDDRRDAISEILNGILQLLEKVGDDKLQSPLGATAATSRANRLESARSRTSLNNVHANLEAIQAIYLGDAGGSMSAFLADDIRTESTDTAVREALDAALTATRSISVPLVEAIASPGERV